MDKDRIKDLVEQPKGGVKEAAGKRQAAGFQCRSMLQALP